MRESLKQLKRLLTTRHLLHSLELNSPFRTNLSNYVERKGNKDPSFRIQHSFSSEGGIAIPWSRICKAISGEWLHLRFYDGYVGNSDQKSWYMVFIPNTHARRPWLKLSQEELAQVISACNEMIKCAKDVLDYTESHRKRG